MRDLVDVYAEARFGKAAAAPVAEPAAEPADPKGIKAYLTMPQLNEKTLAIRNAIEESVRKEQRLKARAKALAAYARQRLAAPKAGITGQVSDIVRAMIPGLSPAAATDGVEKHGGLFSYTTPKAEEKYDLAHILAAGTGAGLGAASQRGLVSTAGGQRALGRLIASAQGGVLETPGGPEGLSKIIAGMTRAKPTTAGAVKTVLPKIPEVLPEIARAGTLRGKLGTLKAILTRKGVPPAATLRNRLLTSLAATGKKGTRLGGWKGALLGAGVVALPFAIRRWLINRQMRAQGGGAAAEAAGTAEANITAAKQLQAWRKKQIAQLEAAVGPGAPAWTPQSASPAPGPSPTPAPAPGPFGRYELAPYAE